MNVYVLDFDGTCTTFTDKEFKAFERLYKGNLFRALPLRDRFDFFRAWDQVAYMVDKDSGNYGWAPQGVIVSPVYADPYSRCSTIAPLVWNRFKGRVTPDILKIMDGVFEQTYGEVKPGLKPEVKRVLSELLSRGSVYIVTNSRVNGVKSFLANNGVDTSRLNVRGNAMKWKLSGLDCYRFEGFSRPVFVDRGEYYRTLLEIAENEGVDLFDLEIFGDLFEMDLALPWLQGARCYHVINPWFPDSEKEVSLGLENIAPILSLEEALE